ncbi:protein neprosin-like [Lolium perenne]|uniref:protein neprosin-like n=1 Tax=Lolium perenne TaxID=4522 RepID=UPI003A98D8F0
MPAMMDMPMLNPTLALSSLHNLAKLAHLSLLSTLDIVPGQGEHDNALDDSWSPRLATPERAPAAPWTRQDATVLPAHFNDSQTYLFTSWAKDNSGDTGCMNLDCEGFRLVSGSPIFPGDIIQPVSDIKGVRQNITIKVFKDKSSGNWWLHCGLNSDPIPVGYFPASLFSSLSVKASAIWVGGHVLSDPRVSSPPMGSGAFASDTRKAALIRDIQLIDRDGKTTLVSNKMPTTVTDDKLYSVSRIEGGKFYYGGPAA